MSFTLADLETNGVCGFPQDQASVLCDNDSLRLSVWNNREYLFVQAISVAGVRAHPWEDGGQQRHWQLF